MFDIIIPVGPNEADIIPLQVKFTQKNVIGYRHIFLIAAMPMADISGCTIISETIFPFSMSDVAASHTPSTRNGWYLQQLLKFYAGSCIPDILDKYLVIDADTFFLKPTRFIDDNGRLLFNYGTEYHLPYFDHMKALCDTDIYKVNRTQSGICHHMIFDQATLIDMFKRIEDRHGAPFWKVFLDTVSPAHRTLSGASEYELYFNYMQIYHPTKMVIRPLKWANVSSLRYASDNDYVSVHWYIRK